MWKLTDHRAGVSIKDEKPHEAHQCGDDAARKHQTAQVRGHGGDERVASDQGAALCDLHALGRVDAGVAAAEHVFRRGKVQPQAGGHKEAGSSALGRGRAAEGPSRKSPLAVAASSRLTASSMPTRRPNVYIPAAARLTTSMHDVVRLRMIAQKIRSSAGRAARAGRPRDGQRNMSAPGRYPTITRLTSIPEHHPGLPGPSSGCARSTTPS